MNEKNVKKVAIVGRAKGWQEAPFCDPSFEIWSFNDLYKMFRLVPGGRWTRWLEVHEKLLQRKKHRQELAALGCPVYLLDRNRYNDIPNAVQYPFAEIVERFFCRVNRKQFFTSSMAYFLALAIHEGFNVVHLYGINQALASEYVEQLPCSSFWVGVMVGRGDIDICLHKNSQLLRPEMLYGKRCIGDKKYER